MSALLQKQQQAISGSSSRRGSSGRQALVCRAQQSVDAPAPAARRAVLLGSLLALGAAAPNAALALIPDDEDEELLKKARANRAKTLADQQATTRKFMQSEGLTNQKLNQDLVPVQKAVYKLAEAGKALETGEVKGAARVMNEDWVKDFSKAAKKFSAPADGVQSGLMSLKDAAKKEDLPETKKAFVSLVGVFEDWISASGIPPASLQGL